MKKNALCLCLIFLFCLSNTNVAISNGMSAKLECNRTKGKVVDFELDLSSVSEKIAAKNIFKEAYHGGCSSGFSSK